MIFIKSREALSIPRLLRVCFFFIMDSWLLSSNFFVYWGVPGSSPGRIQGFSREDGVGKKDRNRERNKERILQLRRQRREKRLIFLGLSRKPIKPQHGTCSVHVGRRRPLESQKVPHLRHLLEWVLDAQARKWIQRALRSMESVWIEKGKRKNDMGRPSFSEQGPHFIFQSSFYTLSCA